MDIVSIFGVISAIIIIGFLSEIIFKKTNIPDILILIGVGIFLGTYLKWVSVENLAGTEIFTTFALVFILFQGALNVNFKTLVQSLSNTFKLTLLNFLATMIVIEGISYLFGYDFKIALLIGTILSGTSSAVVIPLVNNVDIKEKYGLVLTLESALSDVLCIVGTLTIIEVIQTGEVVASGIFNSIISSFSLALVLGVLAGVIWTLFLAKHENLTKSYMVTVAIVIGLYAFVESSYVGASGAIAALAFGLVLGNSKGLQKLGFKRKTKEMLSRNVINTSARNFYVEISFFLKTFFFVYLGILMDFSNPKVFLYGAVLTAGAYLIRSVIVKIVFKKQDLPIKERTLLEILIPKGLAAAVLVGVAVQSGILNGETQILVNMVLSVILLSIILTSVLVFLTEKDWFKGFLPPYSEKKVKVTK